MTGRLGDPLEPGPDWTEWEWRGARYMVSADRLHALCWRYNRNPYVRREVWMLTGDLLHVLKEGRRLPPPEGVIGPNEDWLPWVKGQREFMVAPDGVHALECTPQGWVPADCVWIRREADPATADGWSKNVVPFFDAAAWGGMGGGVGSMAQFPGGTRFYLIDETPVAVMPLHGGRIGARAFDGALPRWFSIDRVLKAGKELSRRDFELEIFAVEDRRKRQDFPRT